MLFLGDIACPGEKVQNFLDSVNELRLFENELVVYNLEGNIVLDDMKKNDGLHNAPQIVNAFSQAKKVIVSLANNHMYDYPEKILETRSILQNRGIASFGLYENGEIKPYEFTDTDGRRYAFFGHCWRLYTNTNRNKLNGVRVVDCPYDEFLSVVRDYTKNHADVKTFCFMHWNYDLEKYPFPMQRTLAQKLIDAGAEGVIGSHSHRPQGFEIYKGKMIAYCLGNFYIPSGIYFGGKLSYPEASKTTYGIRINCNVCDRLWFDTDKGDVALSLTRIDEDVIINHDYPDCIDMSEKVYLDFFKQNRAKKALVPVFTDMGGVKMSYQEAWAILRVKIIRRLKGLMKK